MKKTVKKFAEKLVALLLLCRYDEGVAAGICDFSGQGRDQFGK